MHQLHLVFRLSTPLTWDTAAVFYRRVQHSCSSQTSLPSQLLISMMSQTPPSSLSQVCLFSSGKSVCVCVLFRQRGLSSLVCWLCLRCVLFRDRLSSLLCAVSHIHCGWHCAGALLLVGQRAHLGVFWGFRCSWDCAGGLFLGWWGHRQFF